ncbi:hypothetical protein LTR27_003253 [Elasticomyces elasticus]|nr:hypothetical protein LTR27_003253 [Elasticomyces elasticus]
MLPISFIDWLAKRKYQRKLKAEAKLKRSVEALMALIEEHKLSSSTLASVTSEYYAPSLNSVVIPNDADEFADSATFEVESAWEMLEIVRTYSGSSGSGRWSPMRLSQ